MRRFAKNEDVAKKKYNLDNLRIGFQIGPLCVEKNRILESALLKSNTVEYLTLHFVFFENLDHLLYCDSSVSITVSLRKYLLQFFPPFGLASATSQTEHVPTCLANHPEKQKMR